MQRRSGSSLAGLVMRTGLARNEREAQTALLIIALLILLIAGFLLVTSGGAQEAPPPPPDFTSNREP